jgi:hypothetical protein
MFCGSTLSHLALASSLLSILLVVSFISCIRNDIPHNSFFFLFVFAFLHRTSFSSAPTYYVAVYGCVKCYGVGILSISSFIFLLLFV